MNKFTEKNRIVNIFCFITFLELVCIFLTTPILPELFFRSNSIFRSQDSSLLSNEWRYALTYIFWAFGFFFGSPIIGELSDKVGRRKMLIGILAFCAVSYIIMCVGILSSSLFTFFCGRFILGFCTAVYYIVVTCVSDISSEEEKVINISKINLFMRLGFAVGPVITLIMIYIFTEPITASTNNLIIYFSLPFFSVLIATVLVAVYIPETIIKFNYSTWLVLFKSYTFTTMGLFKNINTVKILGCYFFLSLSSFVVMAVMPIIFELSHNHSTINNALIFIFLSFGYIISHILTKYLSKPDRSNLHSRYAFVGTSILIMLYLTTNLPVQLILILCYGIIELLYYNMVTIKIINISNDNKGKTMGVFGAISSLGSLVSNIIIPGLCSINISLPLIFSAIFLIISTLIFNYGSNSK